MDQFILWSRSLGILKATLICIPMYTTNLSAFGLFSGLLTKGLSEGVALADVIKLWRERYFLYISF